MNQNTIDVVSHCCEKLSIELDLLSQILYKVSKALIKKTKNQQLKFRGYKYSQQVKKYLTLLVLFL